MKKKLMALLLLAGGSMFAESRFAVGVQFGGPAYYGPARVTVAAYRPPCPGPGYVWVNGYYDTYGRWYAGYWNAPRYDRDDYRFRAYDRDAYRGHDWREHEWREHHRDFDRDRDRRYEHHDDYEHGYRR